MAVRIGVYGDWHGLAASRRLGVLHAHEGRGREVFEFEFDRTVLADQLLINTPLDPRLGLHQGRQYPAQGVETFGVFADASPDRWGRRLMDRRFEREQRAGRADRRARLHESDYLLGVHDAYRAGALRFRLNDEGGFLDDRHDVAAPPFVKLRELQAAAQAIERDEENTAAAGSEWLRLLIAPGGSLGGARPKASIVDPEGHLWIAKFPSIRDDHDVGAWEQVVSTLALACGLRVPETVAEPFGSKRLTFRVKRFDRTDTGRRLHFASAMTLTGHADGEDAASGVSYLELARVLIEHGVQTAADLRELWSRIVFNLLVSNADDHLRNHGFLMVPGKGWQLSPVYDMNPVPDAQGLKLNITEADNALDLELARSVAPYFRVSKTSARDIIERSRAVVRQWRKVADRLQIPPRECDRMAPAFRLAN